jgi:hypothetical protein
MELFQCYFLKTLGSLTDVAIRHLNLQGVEDKAVIITSFFEPINFSADHRGRAV